MSTIRFDCEEWARLPLLLLSMALVGCGSNLESEVSGKVTLDDRTVGPGTVVFAPVGGDQNPAVGTIEPNGSYYLKTSRERGLSAGQYRISVTVYEDSGAAPSGGRIATMPKLVVPEKYTAVETSDLEFEVKPGRNAIDIALVSE